MIIQDPLTCMLYIYESIFTFFPRSPDLLVRIDPKIFSYTQPTYNIGPTLEILKLGYWLAPQW